MTEQKPWFKYRSLTSWVSGCAFLIMAVSGVILYFAPRGRFANWNEWTIWGLDKHSWSSLHMTAALLLLVAVTIHLIYNGKVLLGYLRCRRDSGAKFRLRELLVAVAISVGLIWGTIAELPPFQSIVDLNESIKNHWEQPDARLSSEGRSQREVAREDSDQTTNPASVADRSRQGRGSSSFGRMTLAEFCTTQEIPLTEASLALMSIGGAEPEASSTLREIAEDLGMTPREVSIFLSSR